MKKILTLLLIGLCGCAAFPKTPNEFKNGNYAVKTLCSDMPVSGVHELLLNKTVQCYQRKSKTFMPVGNILVPLSSSTSVESTILNDGTRQLALRGEGNFSVFYQQLIEIKEGGEACPTTIKVYELNSNWEKHTARVQSWLNGQEAQGCGLW